MAPRVHPTYLAQKALSPPRLWTVPSLGHRGTAPSTLSAGPETVPRGCVGGESWCSPRSLPHSPHLPVQVLGRARLPFPAFIRAGTGAAARGAQLCARAKHSSHGPGPRRPHCAPGVRGQLGSRQPRGPGVWPPRALPHGRMGNGAEGSGLAACDAASTWPRSRPFRGHRHLGFSSRDVPGHTPVCSVFQGQHFSSICRV